MWRIAKGLYLGGARDANDRAALAGAGITHVLNCAREVPCSFRGEFRYCHLRFTDPDQAFQDEIVRICRFIRRGRLAGGVLVHCAAGLSRSAAAVVA